MFLPDLISGLGIASGEGNGNLLQYLAWEIPQTEEPGGLQSMGLQRVRHNGDSIAVAVAEASAQKPYRVFYFIVDMLSQIKHGKNIINDMKTVQY